MLYDILYGLAAAFGAFWMTQTKDNFARGVLGLLIISSILAIFAGETLGNIPTIAWALSSLMVIVYASAKSMDMDKRMVLLMTGIIALILFLMYLIPGMYFFSIQSFIMLAPIIAFFAIALPRSTQFRNEMGFLTIFVVDGLIKIMMYFQLMMGIGY